MVKDISTARSDEFHKKPYNPEDQESEAAKIMRLRRLRLAKSGTKPVRKLRRRLVNTP